MARKSEANQGNQIALILLELKRHFNTCQQCRGAMTGHDYDQLCKFATLKLVKVAKLWDVNIDARLKARRSGRPFVYACPRLSAHSEAYAMTAEPLLVTGVQETLL
jgi:hypothetical protein